MNKSFKRTIGKCVWSNKGTTKNPCCEPPKVKMIDIATIQTVSGIFGDYNPPVNWFIFGDK